MEKIWVVVANSGFSKILRAETRDTLVVQMQFEHPECHLPARELVSDQLGRMTQRGVYGTDTYQEPTPFKTKEAMLFADQIAQYLEKAFHSGEFEKIYLISKAPFLGFLRESFSSNLSKRVVSEIHKDLTHMSPEEIRAYLPLNL